jgi:protein gp37
MSDLFHEALSNEAIAIVFAIMASCPQHTFQVLTKRPERMLAWFAWLKEEAEDLQASVGEAPPSGHPEGGALAIMAGEAVLPGRGFAVACNAPWPLPNVWLGVSVEDQATADERIPLLLESPAALRFVSYEPAIGPVDFGEVPIGMFGPLRPHGGVGDQTPRLDWLIFGGESGPGARPCDIAWIRSAVGQCKSAGVPVFVKQLGARPIAQEGSNEAAMWAASHYAPIDDLGAIHTKNRSGADPSEWPEYLRVQNPG